MCECLKDFDNDPYFVTELETGVAWMSWYQHFRGTALFVCKQHVTELHQMPYKTKMKYLEEMSVVAEAVYNVFKPDKLNYELLGNSSPHAHWSIIPRVAGDTPQKGPIWYLPKEEMYDKSKRPTEEDLAEMVKLMKSEITRLIK